MRRYVIKRLLYALPTLLGMVLVVFILSRVILPGDPAEIMLGTVASEEDIVALRHQLGLDRPLIAQLFIMLRDYSKGNLGTSIRTRRTVTQEIAWRFPHTLLLAVTGMTISLIAGVLLGVTASTKRGSTLDVSILTISTVGISAPVFWSGILLTIAFAVKLGWFPTIGAGRPGDFLSQLRAVILPGFALGINGMAFIARMTRSAMLDVLNEEYISTARVKGLSESVVLFKHALRNAAIPTVTVVGLYFGIFLGGTVIIETVFARPGLGKLLVDSILGRDYPVIQGVTLFIAVNFVLINLVTDLIYAILDPRIRQR